MVQRSRITSIVLLVLSRIFLLALAIGIGLFFFPLTIHDFVMGTLKYQIPSGFFGFTLTDWILSWEIATTFWLGVIFGTLGKKIDYILIAAFFVLSSLEFYSADNMTLLVYSGLVGAALLGNAIGFALKLLRHPKGTWIF